MTLVKWNPTRSLMTDFDRIFDSMLNHDWPRLSVGQSWMPAVDVNETEKEFFLTADMPGLDKKDVSIDIHDGVITIQGERSTDNDKSVDGYRIRERHLGSFNRSFRLPDNLNEEKIDAKFKNGVLTVTLPKAKEIIPEGRQINIS
jgi:HSP20 family protein